MQDQHLADINWNKDAELTGVIYVDKQNKNVMEPIQHNNMYNS